MFSSSTARLVLRAPVGALAVFLAAVAAGCGSGAQSDESASAAVQELLQRDHGSYSETWTVEAGDESQIVYREWVAFEFGRKLIERKISLGAREPVVLQFLYRPQNVLMWNAGAAKRCGTPWIAMPGKLLTSVTGLRPVDLLAVRPFEILRSKEAHARVVESKSNDDVTVYEVPINPATAVQLSAQQKYPDKVAELETKDGYAYLTVPKDGGPVTMSIDMTEPAELLSGKSLGSASYTVTWLIAAEHPEIEVPPARRVAKSACLG